MVLAASFIDILQLSDWNTRVVVFGTAMLGLAAGVIGSYLLFRKRALFGDTISHAMLPGVVGAFLLMRALGGEGKSFAVLLCGAAIAGTLAALIIPLLRRMTGLKDDCVMGIVLGVGFGLGISMLGVAQALPGGNQAGLESFIYGRTASMVQGDAIGIGVISLVTLAIAVLMAKEFRLLCFDETFGRALGRPEGLLDFGLMLLAVTVTVVGLQAVGLILIIALLIIPATAARFWTEDLNRLVIISGLIGVFACWLGASISAMAPKLPAGSIIVLTLTGCFAVSLTFGIRGGAVWRFLKTARLRRRTARQHLLRAAAESLEISGEDSWSIDALAGSRSWSLAKLQRLHHRCHRHGDIDRIGDRWFLTSQGSVVAERVLRNHRLWEIFLMRYADIAASHVDRDADLVEHVLNPEIMSELESLLDRGDGTPGSPHPIGSDA